MFGISDSQRERFLSLSDVALSVLLLLLAGVLVFVALTPKHHLLKAIILAWVLFP